jgi:cell division protein ZapE
VELTHVVGALGFQDTVDALSGHRLLCIDEFELDDPGDTVLMSTLLSRLGEAGVRLAATSNTLPGRLGEGRFAADDFLREIQGLAAHFDVVRVDGEDYRHRGLPDAPVPYENSAVTESAEAVPGATLDDFDELCAHLGTVHPSRYGPLLDGVAAVHLRGVRPVSDQTTALRLVVLADRLYDRDVPVVASGAPVDQLFDGGMLRGGYRKKYLRAVSRLVALARESDRVTGTTSSR